MKETKPEKLLRQSLILNRTIFSLMILTTRKTRPLSSPIIARTTKEQSRMDKMVVEEVQALSRTRDKLRMPQE
jgi:hypothetical protein